MFLDSARAIFPAASHAVSPSRLSSEAGPRAARPRVRRPGWLLIGSTGRNSGKTEFACAMIRAFHRGHPIVGVKVTTVRENERACPRGGEGCGACSALEGDFQISAERGEHPGKDTARMLESGARRVFWVRCRRGKLQAALEALAPRLARRDLVVAESNSLAQAIEPDLFFMVRNGEGGPVKPTAAEVMPLARRMVVSTGDGFDLNPRHLAVVDGVWRLLEASAAILAGGKSSRMGQDKSLLLVGGSRSSIASTGNSEGSSTTSLSARTIRRSTPSWG
jgi:molybdopterin-guanine dinucleotide biosynthesis protein